MKLSEQVTSLKLSRKLKKLGVKQESLFKWIDLGKQSPKLPYVVLSEIKIKTLCEYYSAFTVAELGEMLPQYLEEGGVIFYWQGYRIAKNKWAVGYWCEEETATFYDKDNKEHELLFDGSTEANARARMLVYLIENNLIKQKVVKRKKHFKS